MKKKENTIRGCAKGGDQDTMWNAPDAIMAVAILAVSADGKLKQKEMDGLAGVLAANPLFEDVENAKDYMGCIASVIMDRGRDEVLEEAAALLSPSLRETAYAWAVYMVSSDRKFVTGEHRFLEVLRKKLKIHGVLAGKINSVVPMLNRVK